MTKQPLLWGGAEVTTHQAELFADDGGHLDHPSLRCSCGRPLCETPSGYWTCPNGCGRLLSDAYTEAPVEADAFDAWAFQEGLTS